MRVTHGQCLMSPAIMAFIAGKQVTKYGSFRASYHPLPWSDDLLC